MNSDNSVGVSNLLPLQHIQNDNDEDASSHVITQDAESDDEATHGGTAKDVFNVFVSITTNSELDRISSSLEMTSAKRNPSHESQACRHRIEEPHIRFGSLITIQNKTFFYQLDSELQNVVGAGSGTALEERMVQAKSFFEEFIEFVLLGVRDVNLTVRKLAFHIFSSWCVKGEHLVMKLIYLRQIYWALFDPRPSIRGLTITVCSKLYISVNLLEHHKVLVNSTFQQIVQRTRDVNKHVASEAFKTILGVVRRVPRLLKVVNPKRLFLLAFDSGWYARKACKVIHEMLMGLSSNNIEFILNTVQYIEEGAVTLGEHVRSEIALNAFIENSFAYSHAKLSDWNAWQQLLLGRGVDLSEHQQELACKLLLKTIDSLSICAGASAPSSGNLTDPSENIMREVFPEMKTECLNHLVQMTMNLGPQLLQLWKKYKNNRICLERLVAIPQYFNGNVDSLDVIGICCFLTRVRNICYDSQTLNSLHCSMARIYNLLLVSSECRHFIPHIQHIFFNPVTNKFLPALANLAVPPSPGCFREENLKVVKEALFLLRYFDVTSTFLLNDVVAVLRFGSARRITEIVVPAMWMCQYILGWQLKNITEHNLTGDKLTSQLNNIQSESRSLVIQLNNLIKCSSSDVRKSAYLVLCRLYAMLSPFNSFAKQHPMIHLPRPSLETSEWLSYILIYNYMPVDKIPEDEINFQMSCVALRSFCLLLEMQILPVSYSAAILIYLQFDCDPKNYNEILMSAFKQLVKMRDFGCVVAESLIIMKLNSEIHVEKIVKGMCTSVLPKLPVEMVESTASKIIGFGLSQIKTRKEYFIFMILTHFVQFLTKSDARRIHGNVKDTFRLDLEREEVSTFLGSTFVAAFA